MSYTPLGAEGESCEQLWIHVEIGGSAISTGYAIWRHTQHHSANAGYAQNAAPGQAVTKAAQGGAGDCQHGFRSISVTVR